MSQSDFHKRLLELLAQLGLPVYLSGSIPGSAPFPYVVCTLGSAAWSSPLSVTATAWFLGRNGNTQRSALCDRVLQLFPEAGLKLPFQGGLATVHRSSGEFITLITDATEPRSLGARIRLTVKLYHS